MIRIGNQETILLGGLEEKRKSKTASGVPFLSRIPVIKWFFSSRTEENKKSKLNILIQTDHYRLVKLIVPLQEGNQFMKFE